MKIFPLAFVITFMIFIPSNLKAGDHEDAMNLDQVTHAFGWNFEEAEIQTQKVSDFWDTSFWNRYY